MDPSVAHHRVASNSYRIAMSQQPHPTTPSNHGHVHGSRASTSQANGNGTTTVHPPSPSRTRPLGSRRFGSLSASASHRTSSLERIRIYGTDWFSHRVFSRRNGPRRWVVLLAVVVGLYLLRQWSTESPDEPRLANRPSSSWSLLGHRTPLDVDPPVVDRATFAKLKLLEIHQGADVPLELDGVEDDAETNVDHEPKQVPLQSPTPTPRTPTATSALHIIGDDDEAESEEVVPLVAQLPNVARPNPTLAAPLPRAPARVVDAEICPERNGEPCEFLLAAWLGEQETKAQTHIYQLGLLAVALNRTLVVPNVGRSRLTTCNPSPFDFYYSKDALSRLGIPAIGQIELIEWAERRDPPATGQVVSLVTSLATYPRGAIEIDSASDPVNVPNKPSRNMCMRSPRSRVEFADYSPLTIYPPMGYHKTEKSRTAFGESVVNTLRSEAVGQRSSRVSADLKAEYTLPNVLVFNYELRYPMLSPNVAASFNPEAEMVGPFQHFPYAEIWTDYANSIIANLSPFIAIHWRTETMKPANLAPCAISLVHKLAQLKAQHPSIKTVYLATDYPIEDLDSTSKASVPHSGTYAKFVTESHHKVFRKFLRDFTKLLPDLTLTTFAKEQEKVPLPSNLYGIFSEPMKKQLMKEHDDVMPKKLIIEEIDSGLYGILDKAIAMRAEVFVTGTIGLTSVTSKRACAKLSSFTNQVINARDELRTAQDEGADEAEEETVDMRPGRLWNDVEYFSMPGGTSVEAWRM
ncbi:BZ3500_MvSof-1268-A1-R1_Chr3-2g06248 [Microbotryum saponariae]|uniref:BZ3500_MvSof-1268-A1-R1_Chr3-2g06248 protein n=1 Tax=Microbotryum saponariae TaxID=289078 RepID=A0A2X0MV52_9BASI|nr:BZ3500_MvSof-1268-A1-R1_Chr3-2g06248 [Microbotryum saponariae]SDA04197.1 BZ3501_MvSof-1269-A2-R1_Chr3-2g05939 [Microbotryum saponariae]